MLSTATYDSLSAEDQDIVREIADAARAAMMDSGTNPANDDRAARFDEAVAVFLVESRKGYPNHPTNPKGN